MTHLPVQSQTTRPAHDVVIIGCGSIGERHLRCFQQTGRARPIACEPNEQIRTRVSEAYHVQSFADWREALAAHPEAAIICTPAPLHIPIAIEAVQRGIHVLIEKPLSHSLQDVDVLVDLCARRRTHAAVAYVYHVFPALAAARQFIREGDLGCILQVTATAGQPFHRLRPAYAETYYRDHASGGGAIQDALTHLANWVESVVGPTDSVLCDCAHQALAGVTVEDTVHVSARHGSALVNYTLNQFQAPNETTLQMNTATASVRVELHHHRWGVFREGDTEWTWHQAPVPDRDTHFIAQANAFLDQIEGLAPAKCELKAAAATLRFNLAALRSAATGQRVHCHDLHV